MRLQKGRNNEQSGDHQFYQFQKVKGNQQLNLELQMKAEELEKLFAAHQLRVSSSNQFGPVELNPNKNIVELGRLNNSKGRLYDRYVMIREEKLRQEWGSKRFQNQEKMNKLSNSLDCIGAVMKATSAGYFNQNKVITEKLTSFDVRREEQSQKPTQIQDDYVSDSSEHSRSFNELFSGDDSTNKSKKLVHSKTFSSSIPRSPVPPIPQSSSKVSSFGKRRVQPAPNFSDIKEDNTKQLNIPRSKSTKGKVHSSNVWRSSSMKKGSPSLNEPKRSSSPNCNSVTSTPPPNNAELKPFLKKGNGIGPGMVKLKVATESENMNNGEETIKMIDKREDLVSLNQETTSRNLPADDGSSERSNIPDSDDIVILKSIIDVTPDLGNKLTSSTFHTPVKPLKISPAQSPASWRHSPFASCRNRTDSDVSTESPMASPASRGSRSLINLETNSPRGARKRWGVSQKPPLIAGASDHQSNNVTKGIRRLLSFGRKTRGAEGVADCNSSTTSEDSRDLASRSSDDLHKSRNGYPQSPCSYQGFKDTEFVSKQVQDFQSSIPTPPTNFKLKDHNLSGSLLTAPKSFFSLPSFRSKGSDLKHR